VNPVDWHGLWAFSVHPLELVLRGSVVYLALFALFRFVLRREAGTMGIADLLLVVLVADAAQNAMAGEYTSLGEGLVLVATLAGWNWALDWFGFRSNAVRRLADPEPLVLVRRGRLVSVNLARELLTVPELMAGLREHGIDKLRDVKMARLEPDGQISVIRYPASHDGEAEDAPPRHAGINR
jgi:uncharacterized membrane protein YcaP (DUF421 family)